MNRLIGIIRDDGALTARLARRNTAPDFESREAVARAAEAGGWYEIVECPLDALEAALFPKQAQLRAAWEALGRASGPTGETRAHLGLTLAETVLGRPSPDALPTLALGPETPAQPLRPTAAHPRAYQGTIYKPPKEKTPAPTDLRPALCGAKRLDLLTEAEEAQRAAEVRLPEPFRTSWYPLVRRQTAVEVSDALALYWALGLDHDPVRLAAIAYLFSLEIGQNTCEWYWFVAALPEEHRTPLLHLLIASGACAVNVQDLPPSLADQLAEVLGGADPLYRAYWLLHGLTTGIAPDYLMAGFRLADACAVNEGFHDIHRSDYFPAAVIPSLCDHLQGADAFYRGYPLHLWERCGRWEGLGEIVEAVPWTQYPPTVAYQYLRVFAASYWDDLTPEQQSAKWRCVRQQISAIETLLQSVPEDYQRKCLLHLEEYLWQWDASEELSANLPAAYLLTQRLCRSPFDKTSNPSEVLTDFLAELKPALRERFLHAPDASFRRLEEACRRENDIRLIGRGTYALTRALPDFSVRCLEAYPALLLKVAKLLGCLPLPVREAVASPFRTSPLFTADLALLPLADAAALAEAHRDPLVFHPVPPRLREHLAGSRTLTPAALAQAAAQVGTQALRTGLEMLEQAALRTLEEGYAVEAESGVARHALQMERLAGDNRRALRKFLRAHWDGQTRYIEDHPQTRRWLAAHPRLDLDVWRQGVSYQREVEAFGQVSLTVAQDPLEALKLGTHVGSCLGLGGGFTHSAAATVLDINKQVVYARDARGTVLARQVVALAEDDRLVCFSVYPLNVKPEVEALFAGYDRRLSQALALPLHDASGDDEYEIACILSHAWWDDWAWDLTVDGDRQPSERTTP